jgi:putative transposase
MKRVEFTQEQIIGVVSEHQAGLGVKDLYRHPGVSDATIL